MYIEVRTRKSPSKVGEDLKAAAQKRKFGVLHVHDVTDTLREKGVSYDRQLFIYEICNPFAAKKVLDTNVRISTALPCRVAVYDDGGETVIITIRPTKLLEIFNEPTLRNVAAEVEEVFEEILEEAARD